MTFGIYYRAADGEILGWTNQRDPVAPDGMSLVQFDDPIDVDPLRQKVRDGEVVDKTAAEQRAARLPTLREVQQAIFAELRRTDPLMLPDYPILSGERHAWTVYRQMLRDLSGDAVHRINSWTLPPDGVDPILALRERLQP
jgi:hypothetical protein